MSLKPKEWELLPVTDGGIDITDANQYTLSCAASDYPVAAVEFFNGGTNSIVRLLYGGISRLIPVGAAWAVEAPAPAPGVLPHIATEFKVEFVNGGGAAAQVNKCSVTTQKYLIA